MANRMLGDLEFRGHFRPATEEFNLAANHDESDVTRAEFLRSFATTTFRGGELLKRERQLKKEKVANDASIVDTPLANREDREAEATTIPLRLPKPFRELAPKASAQLSFTDAYGYRGKSHLLYYLSPWEFCTWWLWIALREPSWYEKQHLPPLTKWTAAG